MSNMEFKQKQLESTIETLSVNKERIVKTIDAYSQESSNKLHKLKDQKKDYQA
jgi:hypothetical protein